MSINNLFYMSYWFDQPMVARGWVMWFWVLLFLSLILAGLLARLLRQVKKESEIREALRRFGNVWLTVGFLGIIWMFFRQERIALFAWRFWLLPILFIFISGHLKHIKYVLKRLPEIKKENWEREMKEKYLPKRK